MKFRDFACFLTLTDKDVLESCNDYDKIVIYSSLIRQILSLLLSFCVLLFGTVQLLDWWQALILSILTSLIFFMLDQAIIGSEWQLNSHQKFFSNKWFSFLNGLINFTILLIRFTPRLIYSAVIALGLATLAELSIQSNAIDRLLLKSTKKNNVEYFEKLGNLNQTVDSEITEQANIVQTLKDEYTQKQELTNSTDLNLLQKDLKNTKKFAEQLSNDLASDRATRESLVKQKEINQSKIKQKLEQVTIYEREKVLEETDPKRGAKCGAKCRNFMRKAADGEREIGRLEAKQKEIENSIRALDKNIAQTTRQKEKTRNEANQFGKKVALLTKDDRTLTELKALLNEQEEKLAKLKEKRVDAVKKNEGELKKAGFFENAEYDILDRYVGLKALHNDPEKGESAQLLSLGLKVFFMLLELSAVIVVLFFSARTVYAEKMRFKVLGECEKIQADLYDDMNIINKKGSWKEKRIEEQAILNEIKKIEEILTSIKESSENIMDLDLSKFDLELYLELLKKVNAETMDDIRNKT